MDLATKRTFPTELRLSRDVLLELSRPSGTKALLQSIVTLGAFALPALAAAWIGGPWWAWAVAWPIQGFILSGYFSAVHDCSHGSTFPGRLMNRVSGVLWSTVIFYNFSLYKHYHLEHHRHTGVAGDTESVGVYTSCRQYFYFLPAWDFFLPFSIMTLQALAGRFPHFVRSRRARRDVQIDSVVLLLWIVAVVCLAVVWPRQVLLYYGGPMLFYFPMVVLTTLPEHYGCDEGGNFRSHTRTLKSNAVFRYLFWNGNYHAEHHAYPAVPSHNLYRVNRLIGRYFKFQERSYVVFHLKIIGSLLARKDKPERDGLRQVRSAVSYGSYHAED